MLAEPYARGDLSLNEKSSLKVQKYSKFQDLKILLKPRFSAEPIVLFQRLNIQTELLS